MELSQTSAAIIPRATILVFTGVLGGSPLNAMASTVAALNASDPMTWLIESACRGSRNNVLAADPYAGRPYGIRKIQSGDRCHTIISSRRLLAA
jgi:hypothetical protein